MPFDLSIDDQTNQNAALGAPPLASQANQNPLTNMAGAASPGMTSPFESVFGPSADTSGQDFTGVKQSAAPSPAGGVPTATATNPDKSVATPSSSPLDPWSTVMGPDNGPMQTAAPVAKSGTEVGAASADVTAKFKDLATQLAAATDPQQKAILHDKLSRDVFGSLSDAGHDVKWDGDQLVVDGRRYIVNGSGVSADGASAPAAGSGTAAPGSPAPGSARTVLMEGDPAKLADPAHAATSPKYDFLQLAQQNKYDYTQMPEMLKELQSGPNGRLWQGWTADGNGNFVFAGNPQQLAPEWDGVTRVDAVGAFGNIASGGQAAGWRWGVNDGGPAAAGGADADLQSLYDQIMTPGAAGAAGVQTGGVPAPSAPGGFQPTAPTYTPGTIDNSDLNGLGMDDILNRLGSTPTPAALPTDYQAGSISNDPLATYSFDGFGDLGELGAGKTDAQTEGLVSDILAHPESYPPQVVDMLKAKSKDELAQMANSNDDDLKAQGYLTGNQDSNWLASERLARKGERDNALVQSNRNIDLTAAQQNLADRRAAAALGQSYGDTKNSRNLANRGELFSEAQAGEGNKQAAVASSNNAAGFKRAGEVANEQLRGEAADRNLKAAQQNIDNQFKSTEEKQAAVKLAADTQLAAASQRGDRAALEQGFQQKATELGQSADKLKEDYILAQMSDLTQRYGIDVGASIDRAKLAQAGTEFQQDLIFRIAQLKQAHDEFGAQYGLDLTKTQHAIDQDAWTRTFGSGS